MDSRVTSLTRDFSARDGCLVSLVQQFSHCIFGRVVFVLDVALSSWMAGVWWIVVEQSCWMGWCGIETGSLRSNLESCLQSWTVGIPLESVRSVVWTTTGCRRHSCRFEDGNTTQRSQTQICNRSSTPGGRTQRACVTTMRLILGGLECARAWN